MNRGYYGIFNNTIYEIENGREPISVASKKPNGTTVKQYENRSIDVLINLTNLTNSDVSNKEAFEKAVEKIQAEGITEIEKLNTSCKMIVYYKLIFGTPDCPIIPDGKVSEVADEGCIVSDFRLYPTLFPLGLTEDNEYVTRWACGSGPLKMVRNYVQSTPIGISRHRESNYTLMITRICVVESKGTGDVYHPSIEKFNDIYPNSKNSVTIYDSEEEGIIINPIFLSAPPSQITLHVDVTLNNFFVTADRSDIIHYLERNLESENTEQNPPVEDVGSDKTDIGSETGGTADSSTTDEVVKDPVTEETPENTTGENTGSSDGVSEGSSTDSDAEPVGETV